MWPRRKTRLIGRPPVPPEQRFWPKVDKNGPNGCWNWKGGVCSASYGIFHFNHKQENTHRVAWEMVHGPIPEHMYICHHCDNKICVNIKHLFLGTARENQLDAFRKGRKVLVGEANSLSKLTEIEVLDIRKALIAGENQYSVAAKYGTTQSNISRIGKRHLWKHLEIPV